MSRERFVVWCIGLFLTNLVGISFVLVMAELSLLRVVFVALGCCVLYWSGVMMGREFEHRQEKSR